MRPMMQDLERARREAGRLVVANAVQGGYLLGLNKEMRRRLGALVGLADGLLDDAQAFGLTPDQTRRIQAVSDNSAGLLAALDRVGPVAELSCRGFPVKPERVDVRWVAHDVLAGMKALADEKDVVLRLADPTTGTLAQADPARLRQLLINLIAYAVHDSVPETGIDVGVRGDDAGVVLSVSAPGLVLSDRQIAFLFGAPSAEVQTDFYLLGVSIAQGVAEAMGATLVATRDPSGGLLLDLTLPSAEPGRLGAVEDDGLGGANLLLVTGEDSAATALRKGLQRLGVRLFTVGPTDNPVTLARDLRPDAILIDTDQPGLDAYRLKAQLEACSLCGGIPVVGLTAQHTPWDERQAMGAGFTAWTAWPVQTGALRRLLGAVLNNAPDRKAA